MSGPRPRAVHIHQPDGIVMTTFINVYDVYSLESYIIAMRGLIIDYMYFKILAKLLDDGTYAISLLAHNQTQPVHLSDYTHINP
ncbi:hypothetical protein IWW55_000582 [Coemansia sp. RSA 2706]|nr:hypothetical protein IWW55_000582 [Coemansia sp. RSA 2706]KAJ2314013.1 hypothetical protein IWW54_001173 [Coemansia sp. RSA 2705]